MGYHTEKIKKGVLGYSSKIREELNELEDAEFQGAKVLEICELCDLVGAINAYLKRAFPFLTIDDLVQMSQLTEAAFKEGER